MNHNYCRWYVWFVCTNCKQWLFVVVLHLVPAGTCKWKQHLLFKASSQSNDWMPGEFVVSCAKFGLALVTWSMFTKLSLLFFVYVDCRIVKKIILIFTGYLRKILAWLEKEWLTFVVSTNTWKIRMHIPGETSSYIYTDWKSGKWKPWSYICILFSVCLVGYRKYFWSLSLAFDLNICRMKNMITFVWASNSKTTLLCTVWMWINLIQGLSNSFMVVRPGIVCGYIYN